MDRVVVATKWKKAMTTTWNAKSWLCNGKKSGWRRKQWRHLVLIAPDGVGRVGGETAAAGRHHQRRDDDQTADERGHQTGDLQQIEQVVVLVGGAAVADVGGCGGGGGGGGVGPAVGALVRQDPALQVALVHRMARQEVADHHAGHAEDDYQRAEADAAAETEAAAAPPARRRPPQLLVPLLSPPRLLLFVQFLFIFSFFLITKSVMKSHQ